MVFRIPFSSFWGGLIGSFLLQACTTPSSTQDRTAPPTDSLTIEQTVEEVVPTAEVSKDLGHGYEFEGNGKNNNVAHFKQALKQTPAPRSFIVVNDSVRNGLKLHQKYLTRVGKNRNYHPGGHSFLGSDLKSVVNLLLTTQKDTVYFDEHFELFQVAGEDSLGNVHFTGYFTPIIPVKAEPDSIFCFPIYRQPPGKLPLPSRKSIDMEGALQGQGLEIAWAKDLLSIYFMQVQGSGYLEFPDGTRLMAQYGGKNGHSYKSLGKFLVESGEVEASQISMQAIRDWFDAHPDRLKETLSQNPSYTFFAPSARAPSGATGLPLTPGYSIAADPKCLPLGSCVLGYVPQLNSKGQLIGHEYRLLLVQDQGAAVKGFGHVDFYTGAGKAGGRRAGNLHHYGNLWLILPKNP